MVVPVEVLSDGELDSLMSCQGPRFRISSLLNSELNASAAALS